MKLEYLEDISDGGRYKQVASENLIRLYDFDESQTSELTRLISQHLLADKQDLDLVNARFLEPINCQLILRLSAVDKGILKTEKPGVFTCSLSEKSYTTLIEIMKSVSGGHNWLCETSDDNIDFLYSPGGTW
jgi:hypothetical protein